MSRRNGPAPIVARCARCGAAFTSKYSAKVHRQLATCEPARRARAGVVAGGAS